VNDSESERIGRKRSWPNFWYYPGICLEGLRKTTEDLNQDNRSPEPSFEPGSSAYIFIYKIIKYIARPYTYSLQKHILII
jgi:hypothetical protein